MVGSDVPVRGAVTIDKTGNALQSIEYRTSGVVITVEPRILGESILMKVSQAVSTFGVTTTSNIDSPTLFKRESETVIDAREGEVIILAGMDETRSSESSSGLSWLPSFLHSTSKTQSRGQVLLLMEVSKARAI
ncbi:MAG: hypothetical protein ACOZCP_02075 [Pseudomonadota bacterium]